MPEECKKCKTKKIRIVYDMKRFWVECDSCKYTYQTKDQNE